MALHLDWLTEFCHSFQVYHLSFSFPFILEDLIILDLGHFKLNSILPSGIAIILVQSQSIYIILGYLIHKRVPDSCPVHHGTFFNVLIDKFHSCKCREIIIFAHSYFINKTQTKQHFVLYYKTVYFLLIDIRYFILLPINTHIDCANNSEFSVRCILKATARSLESVSFCIFCYGQFWLDPPMWDFPVQLLLWWYLPM